MGGLKWPALCWMIGAVLLSFGNQSVHADDQSPTTKPAQPIVWTLDNLKNIGGVTPQVWGSPQVISTPVGPAMQFNGESDGLFFNVDPLQGWSEFTIEALVNPVAAGGDEQRFLHLQDDSGIRATLELRLLDQSWALDTFLLDGDSRKTLYDPKKLHPINHWTWVALEYRDGKMTSYVDGKEELMGAVTVSPMGTGAISLGVRQNKVSWFKGAIRQVIFSPVALPPKSLQKPPQP